MVPRVISEFKFIYRTSDFVGKMAFVEGLLNVFLLFQ